MFVSDVGVFVKLFDFRAGTFRGRSIQRKYIAEYGGNHRRDGCKESGQSNGFSWHRILCRIYNWSDDRRYILDAVRQIVQYVVLVSGNVCLPPQSGRHFVCFIFVRRKFAKGKNLPFLYR